MCAIRYLQDGKSETGWGYFRQAVQSWPPLVNRLDPFYELVCGNQPRGYRGQADLLDIDGNGRELLTHLETLFSTASPALTALCGTAYGNAFLALAMLSDQAGAWGRARRYLLRGMAANPQLLGSPLVLRRLAKLCLGRRLVKLGKSLVSRR
jgi:hypothetical protein